MIKTISEGDSAVFETKINALIEEGYSIMSTNCGYVGEIGNEVYDCEYWMAILNKKKLCSNINMRNLTKEESDSVDKYIKSISTPTGRKIEL